MPLTSPTGLCAETLDCLAATGMTEAWDKIYISCDLETDGPIPGAYSMLNMGSAALNLDNVLLGSWTANLAPLPEAAEHPDTMEFWGRNPEAWAAVTVDPRDPAEALPEYVAWLKALPAEPVLTVYPAWDAMWHAWYCIRFTGEDPTGHAPLCAKSYAAGVLGRPFKGGGKAVYPGEWFDPNLVHTHLGLDDAIGQGVMAINAMRQSLGLAPRPLTLREPAHKGIPTP